MKRFFPARFSPRVSLFAWILTAVSFTGLAQGETFRWVQGGGGNWEDASNWLPPEVPDGASDEVVVDQAISENATISLPLRPIVVAGLKFGLGGGTSSPFRWTLRGTSPLVFEGAAPFLRCTGGTSVIHAPITLRSNLTYSADGIVLLMGGRLSEEGGSWGLLVERGLLDLRMPGAYTGPMVVRPGGQLQLVRPNAAGKGPVTVEEGGTLGLAANRATFENDLTLSGDGGGLGALRFGAVLLDAKKSRSGEESIRFEAATVSGKIVLAADAMVHIVAGVEGTITGEISGTHGIGKIGPGTLVLVGNALFTGGVELHEGVLRLLSESAVPKGAPIMLHGGILAPEIARAELGALSLLGDAELRLPPGSGTVSFQPSSDQQWVAGCSLTISGWTGDARGGRYRILFGRNSEGLSSSQLRQIRFADGSGGHLPAKILLSGEVVPGA